MISKYTPASDRFFITSEAGVKVSEEAPSFATDSKFGDLLVVVVPNQVGLSSPIKKTNE